MRLILEHILAENEFQEEKIAQKVSEYLVENREVKSEEFYHLLRFIITEQKSGPSILKVMMILGREKCLELIENFHQIVNNSTVGVKSRLHIWGFLIWIDIHIDTCLLILFYGSFSNWLECLLLCCF